MGDKCHEIRVLKPSLDLYIAIQSLIIIYPRAYCNYLWPLGRVINLPNVYFMTLAHGIL